MKMPSFTVSSWVTKTTGTRRSCRVTKAYLQEQSRVMGRGERALGTKPLALTLTPPWSKDRKRQVSDHPAREGLGGLSSDWSRKPSFLSPGAKEKIVLTFIICILETMICNELSLSLEGAGLNGS